MKLGFDIDGVVANTPLAMVAYINDTFDLGFTEEVFEHHDIYSNVYSDDAEKNEEIAAATLKNVILNEDAMSAVKVYEDAAKAIRHLNRQHTIHFITSRPKSQHKTTAEWLRKNNIPFDSITSLGSDEPGGGNVGKGRTARTLNLDFFIDDDPDNLPDLYRYKKRWRKGIGLITRPWNKNLSIDAGIFIRFENWNEIVRHLGIQKR